MKPIFTPVQTQVIRALIAVLSGEDTDKLSARPYARELPIVIVDSIESTSWESLTFIGAKHRLAVRLIAPRDSMTAIADRLIVQEIILYGHIVAEVRVVHSAVQCHKTSLLLVIDMLTVADFASKTAVFRELV